MMKFIVRLFVACAAVMPMMLAATTARAGDWASRDLGVPIASDPSVVYDVWQPPFAPVFKVFYRGANDHLWYVPSANDGVNIVGAPVDLGGAYPTAAPAAEKYGAGYRVFYRSTNGHLWYAPYDGGPWWGAPVDLGGAYPTGAPSVIVRDTVKIKVLYRGSNSHLFLTEYNGGQWWGPAWDLGGVELTSDPAAVEPAGLPNYVRAFYRGPDGQLWVSPYDGGQWWDGPRPLGGQPSSAPAAYASGSGIVVIYRDGGGQLVTRSCDGLATSCSAENPTGLYATGAPSAKVFNHIFYRGPNGHLFEGFQTTL